MITAHESKLQNPYITSAQIAGTVKEIVHDAITEAGYDSLGLDENKTKYADAYTVIPTCAALSIRCTRSSRNPKSVSGDTRMIICGWGIKA